MHVLRVMVPWISLAYFVLNLSFCSAKKDLWLGAFLTVNISAGGWRSAGVLPAIQMAIEDVNNDTGILEDYTLKLSWRDTRCQRGYGIKQLVELVQESHKIMLLGGGCSVATEATGETSHYWNLIQIAYSVGSNKLSDKSNYPLLFRTSSPEGFGNPSRIALLNHFNWKRVAMIYQDEGLFSLTMHQFRELLKKGGFTVLVGESITGDSYYQVQNLQKADARIIIGMFYSNVAREVFCQAYKAGMYGHSYVWILVGWYSEKWWEVPEVGVDCTPDQIKEAAGHYIAVTESTWSTDPGVTINGQTVNVLRKRYSKELQKTSYEWNDYSVFGYDAVWSAALALNSSTDILKSKGKFLENVTYQDAETAQLFKSLLFNVSFLGMSGTVKYDSNGDRLGVMSIEQRQGDKKVRIALFDLVTKKLNFSKQTPIYWEDGSPPADQMPVVKKLIPISLGLFITFSCFATLGILMASAFLVFNITHYHRRFIRMSSPRLNNITVVGCILIYLSAILCGLDGKFLNEMGYTIVCQIQTWVLCIGFTLAFGAMFSKTWRVHAIFMQKIQRRVIHDKQLLIVVGCFLAIDVVFLSAWQIIDPLEQRLIYQPMTKDQNKRIVERPYMEQCTCEHFYVWMGIIFVYKGLLLVFGAFLAWETRKVTVPVLNDSKNIGMSVYTVLLSCLVGLPVISVVTGMPDITFTLAAFLAIICSTITLCLLFIPKIAMLSKPDKAGLGPVNCKMAPVKNRNGAQMKESVFGETYATEELQTIQEAPNETEELEISPPSKGEAPNETEELQISSPSKEEAPNETEELEISPPSKGEAPNETEELQISSPLKEEAPNETEELEISPPSKGEAPNETEELEISPPSKEEAPNETEELQISPPSKGEAPNETEELQISSPSKEEAPNETEELQISPPSKGEAPNETSLNCDVTM